MKTSEARPENTARRLFLTISAAVYGLAVAGSLLPVWLTPARHGQLPGFLLAHGIDAHAPFRFLAGIVILTLAMPWALRPVTDRLLEPAARRWAANLAGCAMLGSFWYVTLDRNWKWTLLLPAIAIAAAVALRQRRMHFSSRDAILVPTFLALYIGLVDARSLPMHHAAPVALLAVLAVRLALPLIRRGRGLAPALCFAVSPAALLLESHFAPPALRYSGWYAIAVAWLTPFLLRLLNDSPETRRRITRLIVLVSYPVAIVGYASSASPYIAEGMPRVVPFEEAHHLTPASEMLRGELPYRDIVPAHGLITDALSDYVIMRIQGPKGRSLGRVDSVRGELGGLFTVGYYALGIAAIGSPHVALAAVFAGLAGGAGSLPLRFFPLIVVIALLAAARRWESNRLLGWSAAVAIVAGLTSAETGVYALLVIAIMIYRFPSRAKAARAAVIGALTAGALAALPLLYAGIFVDFLRVTTREVLTLGPAYALDPILLPPAMAKDLETVLAGVLDRDSLPYVFWVITLVAVAVTVARKSEPRRRRFREPILAVAISVLVFSIAYGERHHTYFRLMIPEVAAAAAWTLAHSRRQLARVTAFVIAIALAIETGIAGHLAAVSMFRHTHGVLDDAVTSIDEPPRARGALMPRGDADTIRKIYSWFNGRLGADDTFFDFTNRGLLYFLLRRDCPVRQVEVAMYERRDLQREVIRRIDSNPHVRYALVPPSWGDPTCVDAVPNAVRAPLVWDYLRAHYEPVYEEGVVAIWRRK